jgi:hypothetical protein
MRRNRFRIALGLGAVAVAAATALTVISFASAGDPRSLTSVATQATARFHDFDQAKAAGWDVLVKDKNNIACIDNQPVGGMGVHYANASILFDGDINADQPEALVYAPNAAGHLKLAALEYIVFQSAWNGADPPELFGQQFALTPDGNRFGIPAFWSLHVWIWQPNPSGLLQPWNPRVHC